MITAMLARSSLVYKTARALHKSALASTPYVTVGNNVDTLRRGKCSASVLSCFSTHERHHEGSGSNDNRSWRMMAAGGVSAAIVAITTGDRLVLQAASSAADLGRQLLLVQADDLYALSNFQELYELLEPHKFDSDDDVLWRLARACYEVSKTRDAAGRAALLREGFVYAQEALALNDSNFAVHKWMAILVDEVAALEGSKARILQSFVMRDHMQRACDLNPKDGTSWYLLAMWHYSIADIPWYSRKAAQLLFASPPQSSFQEALDVFLHAEQVEPNFYSQNYLMIGRCYHRLGDKDNAVKYLQLARGYRQSKPTQDDSEAREQAQKLLKELGV